MLSHQNKNRFPKKNAASGGLLRLLAPTLLALAACLACFFGATWAWFSTSLNGTIGPIQTASFTVSAEVVEAALQDAALDDSAGAALTPSENGEEFLLAAGKTYRVTLTAGGTASTGYCAVNFAGANYSTEAIRLGTSLVFYVTAPETDANLSIHARWGTPTAATLGQGMTLTASGVSNTAPQLQPAAATESTTEPEDTPADPAESTQMLPSTQVPIAPSEATEPATQTPTDASSEEPAPTEALTPTQATAAPSGPTE